MSGFDDSINSNLPFPLQVIKVVHFPSVFSQPLAGSQDSESLFPWDPEGVVAQCTVPLLNACNPPVSLQHNTRHIIISVNTRNWGQSRQRNERDSPWANSFISITVVPSFPALRVTKARGTASTPPSKITPTVQASETAGCWEMNSSIYPGETWFPEHLKTSLALPKTVMHPFWSYDPMSPVLKYPSSVNESFVA